MENDFDEKSAIKLSKNKNTSAVVLNTIVGRSGKVDRLVANHPNADSTVLSGLSGSLDVKTLEFLLLNPNTPFETILAIASSLICGKDRFRRIDEVDAKLDSLLAGKRSISYGRDKITVETPDILPPGVQRTYRLPDSEPIVRKLLHNYLRSQDHEQLAIQVVKDKKTSSDILNALLGCSVLIDQLIAKHPNANERVLDELSGNREGGTTGSKDATTRKNVFLNPNASDSMVMKLSSEFPDEFISHPALDRLVTGHGWIGPGIIYRIGQPLLLATLARRDCPQTLLNWTCRHGGAYEQLAVWQNPITPVELLTEMMATGYAQEANVLLAHPEKLLEFVTNLGFVGSSEKFRESGWFYDMSFKVSALWKKLVPKEGEAETIQGEMVRAIGKIKGDYYRNGFGNWYPMYYKLSQFLAAHLADLNSFKPFTVAVIRADIRALNAYGNRVMEEGNPYETFDFSLFETTDIEKAFERLDAAIVAWCKRHQKLIPHKRSQ